MPNFKSGNGYRGVVLVESSDILYEEGNMDKNLEWFAKADLSRFEDEYVAIAEEKVVAHGDDPEEVYDNAKKAYPNDEVVLWKVPKGDVFVF